MYYRQLLAIFCAFCLIAGVQINAASCDLPKHDSNDPCFPEIKHRIRNNPIYEQLYCTLNPMVDELQTLLDADQPNEGQVSSQVDQVLAARGKLEREFTTMNLDLRKVLSLDQWRQLKAVRGDVGGPGTRIMMFKKQFGGSVGTGPEGGDTFYFRQFHSDGGGEDLPPLPPPDLD